MEYIRPSLAYINSLVVTLYERLVGSRWHQDFDLYIRRGGHFVIRMLQDCYAANGMRIPALGIDASRYTDLGLARARVQISLPNGLEIKGKRLLVVDDVADEGSTLAGVKERLAQTANGDAEIRLLTLYKKPWAKVIPDYWAEETDRWIVFPWEPYEVLAQLARRDMPVGELVSEIRKAGFEKNDIDLYQRIIKLVPGNDAVKARVEEIRRRF